MPNTSIHCEVEAGGAPTMREAMRLYAAVAMHGAATLMLTGLLVQLPLAPVPCVAVLMWPVAVAGLYVLAAMLWPESRRDLSQAEPGVIWMRSHASRYWLKISALVALGTAPFWHWRYVPVIHSPGVYHYFSLMAVVNLFAFLWLLMESFCQLREWSLRYRGWIRPLCAWPVSSLLYVVIVPIVAIFVCFCLMLLRMGLHHDIGEGVGARVFAMFLDGILSPEAPVGWMVRALLLMALPVVLMMEGAACLVMLFSKSGPAALPVEPEGEGEEGENESPMQKENVQ